MKRFLRQYCKEIKFLAGPVVVLIVLFLIRTLFGLFVYSRYPSFYHHNISMRPQNPSPISSYFIRPILIYSGRTSALAHMYALLFFYSLMYDHITKSWYQAFALPVQRYHHLISKYFAVLTWVIAYFLFVCLVSFIIQFLHSILSHFPPLPGLSSPSLIVLTFLNMVTETAMLCSVIMIGYTIAVGLPYIKLLTGAVISISLYSYLIHPYTYIHLRSIINSDLLRHYPFNHHVSLLLNVMPWSEPIFQAIVALIILIPGLILYNRFSEI